MYVKISSTGGGDQPPSITASMPGPVEHTFGVAGTLCAVWYAVNATAKRFEQRSRETVLPSVPVDWNGETKRNTEFSREPRVIETSEWTVVNTWRLPDGFISFVIFAVHRYSVECERVRLAR
jgi:hypothetical protein